MSIVPHLDPAALKGESGTVLTEIPQGDPNTPLTAAKPRSMFARGWEVFAENKLALVGLGIVVFMVLFCFVGPLIYRTNQVNTNLSLYLCPPSGSHLLGCDDLGYDEVGRLMTGGQASLEVGTGTG